MLAIGNLVNCDDDDFIDNVSYREDDQADSVGGEEIHWQRS
jgi:hypothetical protein